MPNIPSDLSPSLSESPHSTDAKPAAKSDAKPSMSWREMYETKPLLLAAYAIFAVGLLLVVCSAVACPFISLTFYIPVAVLSATAVVVAAGYILWGELFPPKKPIEDMSLSVPCDKLWEKSQKILDEFLGEEIKTPDEGEEDATVNPAKAELKKHLEGPHEDSTRMGIFLFLKDPPATPEKICQFFAVVDALPEARRVEIFTTVAKVPVPGFATGQYEPMGAFAMTHASPDVRNGYLNLLSKLSRENLFKVLQQQVQWRGLPQNHAMLGMFIVSRELPTGERVKFFGVLCPKLTTGQLWDIKMDDGWTLIWSLLLFGDKEPDDNMIRGVVKSSWLLDKEAFEELLRHRPDGFAKASKETHGNESARNQLNDRLEAMRKGMNDFLRSAAEEYGVEYQDIEWTS
jgi:hypothetical protein